MGLFHITTRAAWDRARDAGEYRTPSLDGAEGFIHLSADKQWVATANRFFHGQRDLVLLSIKAERLTAPVRWELADGRLFPHLYGALNLDAVVEALELPVDASGAIGIPADLLPWRAYFQGEKRMVVPGSPALTARLKVIDPRLGEFAYCVVRDREVTAVYDCFGATSGDGSDLDRAALSAAMIRAPREESLGADSQPRQPSRSGAVFSGPFPRLPDGSLDEEALLALVAARVAND